MMNLRLLVFEQIFQRHFGQDIKCVLLVDVLNLTFTQVVKDCVKYGSSTHSVF